MTLPTDQPNISPVWRKASKSLGASNCVEVARHRDRILVRDSKAPELPWHAYTVAEWDAFLDGAKKGEFDDLL